MWAEDRLIQWEVGSLKDHKNEKTSYFTYKYDYSMDDRPSGALWLYMKFR